MASQPYFEGSYGFLRFMYYDIKNIRKKPPHSLTRFRNSHVNLRRKKREIYTVDVWWTHIIIVEINQI